jgi:serine/threonine-protein kinase
MTTGPVTSFLLQLRQANLLDAAQLDEAERLQRSAAEPGQLARELVKRGWLTPHQANQLALGRGAALAIGSYVVLAPLGGGGMGQVVRARHRVMNRDVALKLIRQDHRDSADTLQRFRREICLLADLRHPYIVQAYDAGQVGDTWFLAMELLEGTDLDRLVRGRGPLPSAEACDYLRQGALGLHHAHQRGLVHRDVKPSNLFLTREGIKVLDLGLARPRHDDARLGDLTRANAVMGTPDYLAPEQALDPRRADARSDVYGLGCTLYFLLTGRPPFPEGTLAQKLLHHQQTEATPAELLRPDMPPALGPLLRQMLAKQPERRPPSALEVARQLAPFAAGAANLLPLAADTHLPAAAGLPRYTAVPAIPPVPSLVDSFARTPSESWSLPTSVALPAGAPPSLVNAAAAGPERGFTLLAESLSPASAPPVAGRPARRRWLIAGGAGLLLLVCLGLVWLGSLIFSRPHPPGGPPAPDNSGAPKEGQAEVKPLRPKVQEKAPTLEPMGRKETEDVYVMPTIAPDKALTQGQSGAKHFLSDLREFAFKTTPTNWSFAKNGRVGDPRDPKAMIVVNGTAYPKGLGMHPPNTDFIRVCYALGKRGASLHGAVALDDGEDRPWQIKTTYFVVLGDGKVLWRSQGIKDRGVIEPFEVDVRSVSVLELRVYTDYDGANGSRAAWLDPYVVAVK